MAPQPPVPAPPPLSTYRPSFERAPLGSGPKRPATPPGGSRPRPPARRGGGVLLAIVYLFLFVVLAGGAGVSYLIFNPPSDLIRQKIAEQVKAKTGRDLLMAGPASFMFYPNVGVSLGDVTLSDPPGMDGTLVRMEALDVSVKALTLLSPQVEINSVVLRKPVFDFRIDKTGRNNWEFAENSEPIRFAELETPGVRGDAEPINTAAADDADAPPEKRTAVTDLRLNNIRLEDGTLRFTDDRSGKTSEVSAVNVKLALPSLDSPLVAKGNLAWNDQRLDFDGKLTDVASAFNKRPAHLSFNAKNPLITASYDGGILIKGGVFLEGQVASQSDSARALAEWSGIKLPPVSGFGPMSIQGTLKTGGHVTDFSNAEFGLDGASAKGRIKVTTGGTRPFVDADLAVSELDLNKYLTSAVTGVLATDGGAPSSDDARDAGPAPPLKPSTEDRATEPDAIENLLNAPNPTAPGSKVYGAVQRAGWSSERLNLTLLNIADGNARLNVGKLRFKNVAIGQSSVAVAVKDRTMTATFDDVALYRGHGKGTVSVDGSADTANVAANLDLDGIAAQPFLKDAANFEWIAGNARVGLQLAANGASQLQLIESLNGKAEFKFADGAIVGFNLPGAIRGISNGDFSGLRKAPSEKTDFSALAASFAISNGVAENKDLQLVSPLLRVTGAGTFHMPERTIDYTVKPKLVASLEGQEGATDATASGIEVPVRISGSWDKPTYRPDLKGVLSDPGKTVETIKEIGKKFKGKSANQIVDQLFGKKDGDDESTAKTKAKAKNFLNKFFGKDDSSEPSNPPSSEPSDQPADQPARQ